MFKNLRKKKKGFTLIELIIVIAIIGILAAIAIPKFGDAGKKAKASADLASAKTIANATALAITEGAEISAAEGESFIEVTGTAFEKYLQGIPKTSDKNNFFITIDTNGDVTVYSKKDEDTQVYPIPEPPVTP